MVFRASEFYKTLINFLLFHKTLQKLVWFLSGQHLRFYMEPGRGEGSGYAPAAS